MASLARAVVVFPVLASIVGRSVGSERETNVRALKGRLLDERWSYFECGRSERTLLGSLPLMRQII